jgi:hypothetical protein
VSEGRAYVGQVVNDMKLGGNAYGYRRIKNALGVVFTVTVLVGMALLHIDASAVSSNVENLTLIRGLVVRPSVHEELNVYGQEAYTILSPTDTGGSRRVRNQTIADLFEESTYNTTFYAGVFPDGFNKWANFDWRGRGDEWVTHIFGPSARYVHDVGGPISQWAWTLVFMKGHQVFNLDEDLSDTPIEDSHPQLIANLLKLWVTGACVHRDGDTFYLVIALSHHGTPVSNKGVDYLIAAELKAADSSALPEGAALRYAPKFELDATTFRVVHEFDWEDYWAEVGSDYEEQVKNNPTMFNQSGTECRQLINDSGYAPSAVISEGGFVTHELIRDFTSLDNVTHSVERHFHYSTYVDSTYEYDAKPNYFTYFRTDGSDSGNVGQLLGAAEGSGGVVNRGADVAWLTTRYVETYNPPAHDEENAYILAVDYKDDEPVYARSVKIVDRSSNTEYEGDAVYGGQSSVSHSPAEFYVDFEYTEVIESITVSKPIVLPFYEVETTDTSSSTLTGTRRDEKYEPILSYHSYSANNSTEAATVLFYDMRYDWLVYCLRRAESSLSYSRTWSYGDSEVAPDAVRSTTTTDTFYVVRDGQVIDQTTVSYNDTVDVATSMIGGAYQLVPDQYVSEYTVPGTFTPPPSRDYSVPANPGETNDVATGVTETDGEPPISEITVFDEFFDSSNVNYGWAHAGVPSPFSPSAPDQYYYDNTETYSPGTWITFSDRWAYSMPWPEEVGVANYVTVSSFGDIEDLVGTPDGDARFFPMFVLPPTLYRN